MSVPFLSQDFGNESEEDNDFNPQTGRGSDEEGDASGEEELKSNSRPRQQANGRASQSPEPARKERSRSSRRDEVEDDELNGDNGEDDEGEGEDLNGDDDEEDEEEEEDEEDDDITRPRKRRRKGVNVFFEEEAEVDEDDDDEAEDDEIQDGFVADTHPDDLDQLPEGEQEDDRRHRELDRQRQLEASMDAEKQAEAFKLRYGKPKPNVMGAGSFVPQNLLMPDVNDPSIWGVRCKTGHEKEIVLKLSKKMAERLHTKNPMRITAAFERGDGPMAGYIFVEAKKKLDVDDALSNVADVYPRGKTNLVPVKEMPDLLRVNKSQDLVRDGYVRIKRGLYQGDLAMIEDVETNGLTATIRLVPRLTYGQDEDDSRSPMVTNNLGADGKRKRMNTFGTANTPATRPPPRLFNEAEAKKRHGRFLTAARVGGRAWNYKGDVYEDGFLVKDFKLQHLITTDVNPKLDEITKLTRTAADGTETLDLESLAHSLRNNTAEGSYMPGDEVEVYDGEQRGIVGRADAVTGNIVSIRVSEGELRGQIVEVPQKGLRKRFKEGDHVKVIGGSRYRDEVGMVIDIKADKVTVLTDNSMIEITVFSKDLREATDSGGASAETNKFDVQDLVQLDPATVGIVVKSDRESIRILDQDGSLSTRMPSQITKIEPRKNAVATDKNGSEIRVGDVVRESGGESKSGTILHVHRSYLFLHNKTQLENSGLWTTRCTSVVTTAAKGGRITAPSTDLTKMNPALQMKNGSNGAMPPPRSMGRDPLQGKDIKIRKGPYKGQMGLVKETTETVARIELQTKNKIVNIPKEELMVIDRNTGKSMDYRSFAGSRGFPGGMRGGLGGASSSRVPDGGYGGRTPMGAGADGGRTPAWGASSSRTPAWGGPSNSTADSSRTPAWKGPGGSQTSYGGTGNMTSYGGGRTPAWSSNARTPYAGDHGFGSSSTGGGGSSGFDAFAAGSRTPAYGATSTVTSRTPAWGGPHASTSNSAPTPGRSYDAPTPGAVANAPTPGGPGRGFEEDAYTPMPYGAPTPGAGFGDAPTPGPGGAAIPKFAKGANMEPLKYSRFDAPTPGASAQTPYGAGGGGYDAPTPAAGGAGGGGPRYAEDSDEE